jgi:hypothetical protein
MKNELAQTRRRSSKAKVSQTEVNDYQAGRDSRLFLTGLYIGNSLLFIGIWIEGVRDHRINFFAAIYLIIPLLGALFGFRRLRKVAQPILNSYRLVPLLFCAGLLSWSIGSMIWMYYTFNLSEEIPYPSWADAGYFPSLLCWTLGIIFLYKFAKVNLLKNLVVIVTCLGAAWGFTLPIMLWAHGGSLSPYSPTRELLKFVLDISYPIWDALNLALFITFLLSLALKKLDNKMGKALLIILLGYFLTFLADLSFNIITSLPKSSPLAYYNAGPTDFMFTTAFYVLSVGISYIPIGQIGQTEK